MENDANDERIRDSNGFFCSQEKCFQYKKGNLMKVIYGKSLNSIMDRGKPFGFDSSEIGTDVVAEGEFRIQHHWSVWPLPINCPMSKDLIFFAVPFRGE